MMIIGSLKDHEGNFIVGQLVQILSGALRNGALSGRRSEYSPWLMLQQLDVNCQLHWFR